MTKKDTSNTSPKDRWLLVTDLDDTLLGDQASLGSFLDYLSQHPDLLLVLNSIRSIRSVQASLQALPTAISPHGIIGAMGTEILLGEHWDTAWLATFGTWDRSAIDDLMHSLGADPHPDEFQAPFKVSYTVPPPLQDTVRHALHTFSQPVSIVRSGEDNFTILPPEAGMGAAVARIADQLEIPPTRIMVAADPGHDLSIFDSCEMGIVVGTARQDLDPLVDPSRAYSAQSPFAAGVLEGIHYWTQHAPR